MSKNFDLVPDRHNTQSAKWDAYPSDVLPLWVADMDFRTPEAVLKILHERIEHGIFGYESECRKLKEVFVTWADKHYGWKIKPAEILFIPGVVIGLNLAAQVLAQPGNGVLIQPPIYPPFFGVARNAHFLTIEAPLMLDGDYRYSIDFNKFEEAITPQTRVFMLCNPHNPVGRVFTRSELQKLAEICIKHDLMVISDEIHCDLIYDGRMHLPLAGLNQQISERTITLMAPSKTFNIAGLKSSMMIIQNPDLLKRVENGRRGLVGEPSIIGLEAAHAAFALGEDWLNELLVYLKSNRDFIFNYLNKYIPQIKMPNPEGTYLAWLDCRHLDLKPNPYEFFLSQAKVALNDGQSFGVGGNGFVRLNFGCPRKTLVEALDRMKDAIHNSS
jgi:cysteine-S-conjugate beta-lyase